MTAPGTEIAVRCAARFWERVDKSTSACWLWAGAKNEKGYGIAWTGTRTIRAHRLAWLLTHGDLPPRPLVLCHSCDNPACVNPDHLRAGTDMDNQRDSASKGRRIAGPWRDKRSAWLAPDRVAAIRAMAANGSGARACAEKFGIHEETARKVIARRTYKRVA